MYRSTRHWDHDRKQLYFERNTNLPRNTFRPQRWLSTREWGVALIIVLGVLAMFIP